MPMLNVLEIALENGMYCRLKDACDFNIGAFKLMSCY
jgi:hypothetical protein